MKKSKLSIDELQEDSSIKANDVYSKEIVGGSGTEGYYYFYGNGNMEFSIDGVHWTAASPAADWDWSNMTYVSNPSNTYGGGMDGNSTAGNTNSNNPSGNGNNPDPNGSGGTTGGTGGTGGSTGGNPNGNPGGSPGGGGGGAGSESPSSEGGSGGGDQDGSVGDTSFTGDPTGSTDPTDPGGSGDDPTGGGSLDVGGSVDLTTTASYSVLPDSYNGNGAAGSDPGEDGSGGGVPPSGGAPGNPYGSGGLFSGASEGQVSAILGAGLIEEGVAANVAEAVAAILAAPETVVLLGAVALVLAIGAFEEWQSRNPGDLTYGTEPPWTGDRGAPQDPNNGIPPGDYGLMALIVLIELGLIQLANQVAGDLHMPTIDDPNPSQPNPTPQYYIDPTTGQPYINPYTNSPVLLPPGFETTPPAGSPAAPTPAPSSM